MEFDSPIPACEPVERLDLSLKQVEENKLLAYKLSFTTWVLIDGSKKGRTKSPSKVLI